MKAFAVLTLLLCAGAAYAYVQFEPVLVPRDADAMQGIMGTKKVTYGRFSEQRFQRIARTTEDHNCITRGCTLLGEVLDILGNNVTAYDQETLKKIEEPAKKVKNGKKKTVVPGFREVQFSHAPSGGVLLQEEEVDTWFMLYQFERPNPGNLYRVRVRLENDTDLASRLTVPVRFAPYGGLWKPRVATTTPSSTMLGTEGIAPDARLFEQTDCLWDEKEFTCFGNEDPEMFYDMMDFMRYFGRNPEDLLEEGLLSKPGPEAIPGFKPYRYGFPYEIALTINDQDRVVDDIAKLYALGRTGAHGIAVMQDGFTVYIAGGQGGLFRYVDDFGDFKSGELFAAVLRVTDGSTSEITVGTKLSIGWLPLGFTDSANLEEFVGPASPLKFADMFQSEEIDGGLCSSGFKVVKIGEKVECLKLIDDVLAAVFEPLRLAGISGATTDVFKFSQMATRLDSDRFYIGVEEILGGDLEVDEKGSDEEETSIAPNKCGCVFEVKMDSDFVATEMVAVMCGDDKSGLDEENTCNTEAVANPRSLTFANQFDTLLVGEDSPHHGNNFIWSYDPETRRATRIFHSSKQGRVTSLTWLQDVVGGNNYIGVTIADPFDRFGWLSYFGSFDLTSGSKLTFSGVPVPYAKGPKELPVGFSRVTAGEDEKIKGFTPLFSTGAALPETGTKKEIVVGQVVDEEFKPVDSYREGPVKPERTDSEEVAHKFAFTSIIDTCGSVFSVAVTDSLPATSYVVSLEDGKSGLQAKSARYIDWSRWGGLWRSGGGVVTPWNTHLAGELFEPDGLDFTGFPCLTGFSGCFKSRAEDAFEQSLQFIRYKGQYLDGLNNKFEALAKIFNPYQYGYAYEVRVNKGGCVKPTKYMTLGRFSHGGLTVMPDRKTVYMTDHTTGRRVGGGLFKFVATKEDDLSAGTLYAAKFTSKTGTLDKFEISWVKLGSASNEELAIQSRKIRFVDIFDSIPTSKTCRLKTINTKSEIECIQVKKGMEKWAAFFETRRYAALLGASVELANVKGIVYDPNTFKVHISVSTVTQRDKIILQDDIEGSTNDVKVRLAPCGCLYSLDLKTNFDVIGMNKFACGTNEFGTIGENTCNIEAPAFPADLAVIPGHRQVIVTEESCVADARGATCGHQNNAMWMLDSARGSEYTRVLTSPIFSSVASPQYHPKINKKSYITAVVNELYRDGFNDIVNAREPEATFGFLGPLENDRADARRTEFKVEPKCYSSKGSSDQCPAGGKNGS